MWATNQGLFLEREIADKEEEIEDISFAPVLFSLVHPLEELKPVSISGNIFLLYSTLLFLL